MRSRIAEFERGLIQKRCQAAIERARAKGLQILGRPVEPGAGERRKIAERYAADETMEVQAHDYWPFDYLARAVCRVTEKTLIQREREDGLALSPLFRTPHSARNLYYQTLAW